MVVRTPADEALALDLLSQRPLTFEDVEGRCDGNIRTTLATTAVTCSGCASGEEAGGGDGGRLMRFEQHCQQLVLVELVVVQMEYVDQVAGAASAGGRERGSLSRSQA